MQLHPLANFFRVKLIRFGQIWLDFGDIWGKLRQKRLDLGIFD